MSMISPAFEDAVHDSQQCFRLLLKAMSEPGTIVKLDKCDGFGNMMSGAAQVLLSMADNATPVWLSSAFSQDRAVSENIKFHVSAPIVNTLSETGFALFSQHDLFDQEWSTLSFNLGNEEYPDTSTTVVVELDSLTEGNEIVLTGPGIENEQCIAMKGLPSALIQYLTTRQNRSAFPLGIDFIFVAGQQVLCLPRTTKVEVSVCTLQ
ncbi:phosphonate C-P lyase system protein PhnH [Vibrio kyushuensis]|uniref:phosphonate C-P lyase system protein PhnH n=1 Tax=Vibrio kyushuensis TaxID=2910249 RepID=UPI003D0F2491